MVSQWCCTWCSWCYSSGGCLVSGIILLLFESILIDSYGYSYGFVDSVVLIDSYGYSYGYSYGSYDSRFLWFCVAGLNLASPEEFSDPPRHVCFNIL